MLSVGIEGLTFCGERVLQCIAHESRTIIVCFCNPYIELRCFCSFVINNRHVENKFEVRGIAGGRATAIRLRARETKARVLAPESQGAALCKYLIFGRETWRA